MSINPYLEDWNYQVLMLVQSLVGAISPNFRMVALCYDSDTWILEFYLEADIEEDMEEIEEVVCQYTAYQDTYLRCREKIIVGLQKLPGFTSTRRVVYRRRELCTPAPSSVQMTGDDEIGEEKT